MIRGEALKEWRQARGLTQHELAERLGVRPISVSRWERGVSEPPGKLLELALIEVDRQLVAEKGGQR